ncbi:MAG: hypothetical protein Q9174_006557, partial [Haloplaca sp. 1 TL-2023]
MSLTFALQSLLARHEAYVFEAEEERRKMASSIGKLECDKKELEAANARTITENRNLLDQLEDMNNMVMTSDAQIAFLNATLESSRRELERVTAAAAKATHLEAQLSAMDTEQAALTEKLASSEEDHRSTLERWREAERNISGLHEQIDRIEAEAKDQTARHAEVMHRLERRQAVEKQLESAAGRLKSAAATTSPEKTANGNNKVVSHFVKDILADNASLQMGIIELREMLSGSNEEVQNLRQQMMLHQEVPTEQRPDNPLVTMEKDLGRTKSTEPDSIPALHVHHHYHEANKIDPNSRPRSLKPRRSKRRFSRVTSGTATPSSADGVSTPTSPSSRRTQMRNPSTAATILSQTLVSIPPPPRFNQPHRISVQSSNGRASFAPSSQPSSAHPSMFDFVSESSRPTSPDSVDPFSAHTLDQRIKSPTSAPLHASNHHRNLSIQDRYFDGNHLPSNDQWEDYSTIDERPEHLPEAMAGASSYSPPPPPLRRSASHESILSIAPLSNQKTLRKQSSHLFRGALPTSRTSIGRPSSPITSTISSQPTINATLATAAPSNPPGQQGQRPSNRAPSLASSTLTSSLQNRATADRNPTLSKRMGGWVWNKWGIAPNASSSDLRAAAGAKEKSSVKPKEVPTGVNQKGSLKALKDRVAAMEKGDAGKGEEEDGKGKRVSSHVEAV